jgi:hypothetical protein
MTVQEILNSNFTKTKKACLLFDLGYTRTDVSRLITSGNYGFAHNIWKKWNAAQPDQVQLPSLPFEFTFNRTFGIELEIYNASRETLIREFRAQGLTLVSQNYNHTTPTDWKIVSDGSIRGVNGNEIVSPVLSGFNGIEQIKKATIALTKAKAMINESCGFHVHFGASDFNIQDFKNLAKTHIAVEEMFDSIVPKSRRANTNTYCKSLTSVLTSKNQVLRKLDEAGTINDLTRLFHTRYLKLNFQAFTRQGTIEIRQHSGTTTFSKIKNWILICGRMMEYVKQNGFTNNQNSFLNESLQDYISDRAVDLAA